MTEQMAEFRSGQEVIAEEEAIGELVDIVEHQNVHYLHVRRYGPGEDELYIPSIAVKRVVPKHVYLDLAAADLAAQPWHERPTDKPRQEIDAA
jgi:hypothetical protein